MTTSSVYDAVKARLVDQLGGTYAIRDWEEVEVALQQGVDPWIAIEDSGSSQELTSIGTPSQNWVDDSGFIDIHVFVPSTGGLPPARTLAQLARESMQFYHFPMSPGETLRVQSVSSPEPGLIHDGLWHSMFVTVDFIHRYAAATAA